MNFIKELNDIYNLSAPYLVFGLLISFIIKLLIDDSIIKKYLSGNGLKDIFFATLIGIPLPLCSCSIIPLITRLRRAGAAKSTSTAFLISTPETSADAVLLSYGIFGPWIALLRIGAVFILSLLVALIESLFNDTQDALNKSDCFDACCLHQDKETKHSQLRLAFKEVFVDILDDMSVALIVGFFVSAAVLSFIPDSWMSIYSQNLAVQYILVLGIALAVYVCASSSTPLAAVLYLKGFSLGSVFIFLLAGPLTNITSISVLSKSLGKATVIRIITMSSFIILLIAFILDNYIVSHLEINPNLLKMDEESSGLYAFSSIILTILLSASILRKIKRKRA